MCHSCIFHEGLSCFGNHIRKKYYHVSFHYHLIDQLSVTQVKKSEQTDLVGTKVILAHSLRGLNSQVAGSVTGVDDKAQNQGRKYKRVEHSGSPHGVWEASREKKS